MHACADQIEQRPQSDCRRTFLEKQPFRFAKSRRKRIENKVIDGLVHALSVFRRELPITGNASPNGV
jgi:hypothetical protein